MGPTLNTAAAMNAYTLADRGTWLNFHNRGDLAIAVAGDRHLFNQYGVILANPAKYPSGEQLFFPSYRKRGARYKNV